MGNNAILWALGALVEGLLFALWSFGIYAWRYSSLPNHSDPVATWNWAARESQVLRQMHTFDDVGLRLRHLALSPTDPQFDMLFITCDVLLFGYAILRVTSEPRTLVRRITVATGIAFLCSSWTLLPIPPQATGFPLLAYTRLVFWIDPLTAARAVITMDAWRHGGTFGWVSAILLPLQSLGTMAIGSAFGGAVASGLSVGLLASQLFREKSRYIFTNDAPVFPPSRPTPPREASPPPLSEAGTGLP
jgi:hypothetical protein